MKKSEKIKQLEAQIQELNYIVETLKEYVYSLGEANPEPEPEPYFPKLSKMEAYHLALEYCKLQPEQHITLESFLSAVDVINEWYNKGESIPQPETPSEL